MLINEKYQKVKRPIKVLQFGEGNFLRCFIDWIISYLNDDQSIDFNSNVVVVQPLLNGMIDGLKKQDGLYTVLLKGIMDGKTIEAQKVIDVLGDFINPYTEYEKYLTYAKSDTLKYIISNTTEAGIVYDETDICFTTTPKSYPGKLLSFLKERYDYFKGNKDAGLDIIPCELIDKNGDELKEVLVKLAHKCEFSDEFIEWLVNANRFYNTLVDRIVPGFPRNDAEQIWNKLGYIDNYMTMGEIFHLWVIEDHHNLQSRLKADQILNVKFVKDITLYKERKVRILNGSHTLMVPVGYLAGYNTVGEIMKDSLLSSFVKGYIFKETIPTIDLPEKEMITFANSVLERYQNPYINHQLLSIALNSLTKFKTRIFTTITNNLKNNLIPKNALYSLAALIVFYRGKRNEEKIPLNDSPDLLEIINKLWKQYDEKLISSDVVIKNILSMKEHWGIDLSSNQEVLNFVQVSVSEIIEHGVINEFFKQELHFE